MTDCVIDIETAGPAWDELDEFTRDYLEERAHKKGANLDGAAANAQERLALDIGLASIEAIGMLPIDGKGQECILLHAPAGTAVTLTGGMVEVYANEGALLTRFWTILQSRVTRVITFNGRAFDAPMLMMRSSILGAVVKRNLMGYRYSIKDHCDLADVITGYGASRDHYSLGYWAARFGIANPKTHGATGAEVGRLVREARYQELVDYLDRDLNATGKLYMRLRHWLSLLDGGPSVTANLMQDLFG